jgi:hypothetical protein
VTLAGNNSNAGEIMNLDFRMQAGCPRSAHVLDEEDENVCSAMQSVFPLNAESAYMVWNGVHVPLGYKYTVSFMIQDIVLILDRLATEDVGQMTNRWPVQELAAVWHLQWEGEVLEIRSEWTTAPGGTEAQLARHPSLTMNKAAFISEWKQVLAVVLEALTKAGYGDAQLADLAKLREVYRAIREPGVLYR